jgi:uncharacterized membrane protein YkvA (DUF1232 family)
MNPLRWFRVVGWMRRAGWRRSWLFVKHFPAYMSFYLRLFADKRVPLLPKLLVVGAILYVASPLDLLPDFIPFIGELDDIALILFALNRLVAATPASLRRQHEIAAGIPMTAVA